MIFLGTWKDGEGVPFDRNAKVLQLTEAGGIACASRTGLVNHPMRAHFAYTARNLTARWFNALDQNTRDDWELDAVDGPSRRGNLGRTATPGYIHYQAAAFAKQWSNPPTDLEIPAGPPGATWVSPSIYYIHVPDQTVNFITSYSDHLVACTSNILCVFQINPQRVRNSNPWRQTRLLHIARMTVDYPPYYQATLPLRWPVKVGDLVGLYFRGRARYHYNFHAYNTLLSVEGEWP